MVSAAPRLASTAAPISSLKYGKCHWSGASTTPSRAMNRPAVIFLMVRLRVRSSGAVSPASTPLGRRTHRCAGGRLRLAWQQEAQLRDRPDQLVGHRSREALGENAGERLVVPLLLLGAGVEPA